MTKSFDEWWEENYMNVSADKTEAFDIYSLGQQSKQAEIDELREMVRKLVENTVLSIDDDLENQANDLLKGNTNDH